MNWIQSMNNCVGPASWDANTKDTSMSEQKQSLNTQLANAVAAVAVAQDHLGRMCESTARAQRNETDARNKVNEAQKHFDELVALVKKSAPRDTDWKRPAGIPVDA